MFANALTSTMSAYLETAGSAVAVWVTLLMDGTFRLPDGTILEPFDVTSATFWPEAYVHQLRKFDPAFASNGTVLPVDRLREDARMIGRHRGKSEHDIAGMLAHDVYGARVPSLETIINANTFAEIADAA